jgi:hypothetical protein
MQVPRYFATGLKRPSGTNSPPVEASTQVSSVVLRPKKLKSKKNLKTVKEPKNKYCAWKLSQIRRRIELCMREIILLFEMNL